MTRNEKENIESLVPWLRTITAELGATTEIVVIDDSEDGTPEIARQLGCRVFRQQASGYGAALRQGIETTRGEFVVTMDADHSHKPGFLHHMWALRDSADVVIGSRYVAAGRAELSLLRRALSAVLNWIFRRALALPFLDLSSGYRLYRRSVLTSLGPLAGGNFDILQEILIKAFAGGWTVREVPIHYRARHRGRSNASALRFAVSYLRTLRTLWSLRNSATSCDYDARAFNSWVLPQRYWQRRRFAIIADLFQNRGSFLDIGCGASQIIRSMPAMVGMDTNPSKLRFLRATNPRLVRGSAFSLPFRSGVFSTVVCSEVIEHIPKADSLLHEMYRVLEVGGTLILGTPDYSSRIWCFIEYCYGKLMPMAYADEHISHYTREEVMGLLTQKGFEVLSVQYIVRSEMIVAARKRA